MTVYSPSHLEDALDILRDPGFVVIAGGTDYFPSLKMGGKQDNILNVMKLPEMNTISFEEGGFRIGGAVSWTQIINSDLPAAFDALKAAGQEVGSIQIQNAGTIAGNLCNASPAADGVPPLLALEAEIELQSAKRGKRQIPLVKFLKGIRTTDRQKDELVTSIFVPHPPKGMKSNFTKLGSRSYLVISICMTALSVLLNESGRIIDIRIAVGACSPVAQRLKILECEMIGCNPNEVTIDERHLLSLTPINDVRGSAVFRQEAVAEQILRSLSAAVL